MGSWEVLTLIILGAIAVLAIFISALTKTTHQKLDEIHTTTKGIRTKIEDHATGAEHHRRSWSDRWRFFTHQLDTLMDLVRSPEKEKSNKDKPS